LERKDCESGLDVEDELAGVFAFEQARQQRREMFKPRV
jgi:hypothetical protein